MRQQMKRGSVLIATVLAAVLIFPVAAFATTYPGTQVHLSLTTANGGLDSFQANTYIEPATRRLTAGVVVKCSTSAMPAKKAKSTVRLYDQRSVRLSETSGAYSQAVSKNQFSYCTTSYSVSAGSTVTGYSYGRVQVKDAGGSYNNTMAPYNSPTKSSL